MLQQLSDYDTSEAMVFSTMASFLFVSTRNSNNNKKKVLFIMRVFTTQGFQPNDVEGWYCYLEDQRGHYVATIDIEMGVIKVSANRSDYEAVVNVNDVNDQDYIDDIREGLFGGVD